MAYNPRQKHQIKNIWKHENIDNLNFSNYHTEANEIKERRIIRMPCPMEISTELARLIKQGIHDQWNVAESKINMYIMIWNEAVEGEQNICSSNAVIQEYSLANSQLFGVLSALYKRASFAIVKNGSQGNSLDLTKMYIY